MPLALGQAATQAPQPMHSAAMNARSALVLGDGRRVGVGGRTGVGGDVAAGLDDPVERATVDDEVADDREGLGAPRLDGDRLAGLERAHVQLAGRRALGAVGVAGDHQTAHAADALATVAVERDRLVALGVELLVEDVEHLEEGHVRADVRDPVGDEAPRVVGSGLAPDLEGQVHDRGPRKYRSDEGT